MLGSNLERREILTTILRRRRARRGSLGSLVRNPAMHALHTMMRTKDLGSRNLRGGAVHDEVDIDQLRTQVFNLTPFAFYL